ILILLLGVAPATAVGTDLWFAAITKVFGGAVHHQKRCVDWQVFRRLCLGSLPASVLTLLALYLTDAGQVHDGLILKALGLVMILTAGAMLFKQQLHRLGRRLRVEEPRAFKRVQPALTV